MCYCVHTVRNLVRGRGKFNVCEEIISLLFTVHDTSHHICKQCLKKLQKRRGLRTRQAFRRKPAKETKIFSRNKQRSRKFKHFTTASEIKSYREHPQKHKPQKMITQYACNKPASWPLNVRLSQNLDCYVHCVVRERKEEKPLFKQTLKITFRIITSLWCFVWPVNSYYWPDIISQFMRNRIPCQRDAGTQLATALRRRPFSACNKGNRRRLHAGKSLKSLF